MNKVKLFVNNFLVYGLGSVISKIIPFIILPILTRLYPNPEYMGLNDLVISIASMGSAIAILGINNAMFRLFFERDSLDYKKEICSSALGFVTITSVIVAGVSFCFRDVITNLFFKNGQYKLLVIIAIICMLNDSLKNIISTPTRMENKRRVFLFVNTISPICAYTLALVMIKNGMYVLGLPLAMLISALLENMFFMGLNRKWFSLHRVNWTAVKQLCILALPLAPNFLIYWIFNSCDKLMITNMLGTYAVGLYSVGAKMGHISQLIYTAFASGWQYFAFYTMKDKDQVKSNSSVFDYLNVLTLVSTIFVCLCSGFIFRILFPVEYMAGRYVMPYLFLAPLLMMLFQTISNQFLIIKKTWPNALILAMGAVTNVVLNIVLIPRIGIEGAAVATLSGYLIAIIVCAVVLVKMKLLIVCRRIIGTWILFAIFFVLWRFYNEQYGWICASVGFAVCAIYTVLYRNELKLIKDIIGRKGKMLWKKSQ